jgi:hypothetical protein
MAVVGWDTAKQRPRGYNNGQLTRPQKRTDLRLDEKSRNRAAERGLYMLLKTKEYRESSLDQVNMDARRRVRDSCVGEDEQAFVYTFPMTV